MNHRIFDVARWSTSDIEGIMSEQGIELTGNDHKDFIEAVIVFLGDYFDASVGINWGVIEDAVHDVAIDWEVLPNE